MADLSLDDIIATKKGSNFRVQFANKNVRTGQQKPNFKQGFVSKQNRLGVIQQKRALNAPGLRMKTAFKSPPAQNKTSNMSGPGHGQIDARDMITIKNRIKIPDARAKIIQKRINQGSFDARSKLQPLMKARPPGPVQGRQQQQKVPFQPIRPPGLQRFQQPQQQGVQFQQQGPQKGPQFNQQQVPQFIQQGPGFNQQPGPQFNAQQGQGPQFNPQRGPQVIQQQGSQFKQQGPQFMQPQNPQLNPRQGPLFQQGPQQFNQQQQQLNRQTGPQFNQPQPLMSQPTQNFNQQPTTFNQPFQQVPDQNSSGDLINFTVAVNPGQMQMEPAPLTRTLVNPLANGGALVEDTGRSLKITRSIPDVIFDGNKLTITRRVPQSNTPEPTPLPLSGRGPKPTGNNNAKGPRGPRPVSGNSRGPRQAMDTMGGPRPAMDNTWGSRPVMDNMPGSRPAMDNMQGPRQTMNNTRGPRQMMDNTRGPPRQAMDNTREPRQAMNNTRGPRPAMDNAWGPGPAMDNAWRSRPAMDNTRGPPPRQAMDNTRGPVIQFQNDRFQPTPIQAPALSNVVRVRQRNPPVQQRERPPSPIQAPFAIIPAPTKPSNSAPTFSRLAPAPAQSADYHTNTRYKTVKNSPSAAPPPPRMQPRSAPPQQARLRVAQREPVQAMPPKRPAQSAFSRIQLEPESSPLSGRLSSPSVAMSKRLAPPPSARAQLSAAPPAPAKMAVKRRAPLSLSERFGSGGGGGNPIPVITDHTPIVKKRRAPEPEPEKELYEEGFEVKNQFEEDEATEEESGVVLLSPLQGFRILVSNLHSSVTQDDIIELFGAIGPLKRANLMTKGQSEVAFIHREHAILALKKYHNRELDGQPMFVKLTTPLNAKVMKDPASEDSAPSLPAALRSTKKAPGQTSAPVEIPLIHKALFKTGADTGPSKSVRFTVKL